MPEVAAETVSVATSHSHRTGRDEPVAEWAKAYGGLYPRYHELYGALKPTYDRLMSP